MTMTVWMDGKRLQGSRSCHLWAWQHVGVLGCDCESALGLELGRVASHPHDFRSYDAGPKIES